MSSASLTYLICPVILILLLHTRKMCELRGQSRHFTTCENPHYGRPRCQFIEFHCRPHCSAVVCPWKHGSNLSQNSTKFGYFSLSIFKTIFLACNSSRQNTHITIFIRLPKHLAIFKYVKSSPEQRANVGSGKCLNFWSDISRMRHIRVMYNVISQKRKKRRKQYQSEAT